MSWHPVALKINHYWAMLFFRLAFIPYSINYQYKPKKGEWYIICANHFSFLDIPALGLLPVTFKFFGKSSLSTIPVFGYMYRKIHITVNRSSLTSKKKSFEKARKALDLGFNLAIFPEGGIFSKNQPEMVSFKEGAFMLAAQKNIPILPVTFLNNYKLLPDNDQFIINRSRCEIVVHGPVIANGNTDTSIAELKTTVFEIIQNQLHVANKIK
ncbi:MAG: lysophospholipid acyltransferase family protein [Bacteroidota bacterium]